MECYTYSEDGGEGDFGRTGEGEDGKVSEEAWGYRITTAPRRGTRCADSHILNTEKRNEHSTDHQ